MELSSADGSREFEEPRYFRSARPFRTKAEEYRKLGWLKPIPIPARKKDPPPTEYTGKLDEENKRGLPVDEKILNRWLTEPEWERSNIAQHLGFTVVPDKDGIEYAILGIDVDHHLDDSEPSLRKLGGEQLSLVEQRLEEKLPETWIASARTNGLGGTRFYLVPKGLQWRGNCTELGGKHIDVISVGYRYQLVYPSIHPSGGQYLWYPPGVKPLGQKILREFDWESIGYELNPGDVCCIPNVMELPKLGPKWIEFLSRGGIVDPGSLPIDMNIGDKDLKTWAVKNLAPATGRVLEKRTGEITLAEYDGMCFMVRKRLAVLLERIRDEDASHYPLQDGHWELIRLGVEGHSGWLSAIKKLEVTWIEEVMARHKRSVDKMNKEIYRSKFGSLRKVKGEIDAARENGVDIVSSIDTCYEDDPVVSSSATQGSSALTGAQGDSGSGGGGRGGKIEVPRTTAKPPNQYALNDDGNAEHWLELHEGLVRWVPNVLGRWIIWNGHRWFVDDLEISKTLFRRVKARQENYAKKLMNDYEAIKGNKNQNAASVGKLAEKWRAWSLNSGNTPAIHRALDAAKTVRDDVSIKYEELDSDRRAFGTGEKVLRLNKVRGKLRGSELGSDTDWRKVIEIVENSKDFLITKNTGIEYIPLEEQARLARQSGDLKDIGRGSDIGRGYNLFMDFLEKFIKPSVDVDYFQKLCGSILLRDEANKFAIFFWGPPDTCKSTMADLMVESLGDYGCTRNPDFFKGSHLNPALATALSTGLVYIDELGNNMVNSNHFKSLTGGGSVQCELKGSNNLIEDFPQFTILVTTNQAPRVPDEDTAFRERLRVIEFKHQVKGVEKERGKRTQRDLLEYGKIACFAWLVEGAARCEIEGLLPIPPEILLATENFASELSDFSSFAQDWLEESEGDFLRNEDLLAHFRDWAGNNNFNDKEWTPDRLGKKLADFGIKRGKKYVDTSDGRRVQCRGLLNVKKIKGKEGQQF